MHDPMTVAFEIRYPWKAYKNPRSEWERGYRSSFITIWHVDPEKGGSDDSCDWFGRKTTKREKEFADYLIDNEVDNLRHFFAKFVSIPCDKHSNREDCYDANCRLGDWLEYADKEEMKGRILQIFRCYKREFHWRYPVRWHFWHWQLQIHPLKQFKRWAFSRCCKCGKRFTWGYAPCTHSWNSKGPRWFRGETDVYHGDCSQPDSSCLAQAAASPTSTPADGG